MNNPTEILKRGHLLIIKAEPEILCGLALVLCTETYFASGSFQFGTKIETKEVRLWRSKYPKEPIWDEPEKELGVPPEITVLAGLEGLVVSALNAMQVPFTVTESRPKSQPELVEGQYNFRDCLHFIANKSAELFASNDH